MSKLIGSELTAFRLGCTTFLFDGFKIYVQAKMLVEHRPVLRPGTPRLQRRLLREDIKTSGFNEHSISPLLNCSCGITHTHLLRSVLAGCYTAFK